MAMSAAGIQDAQAVFERDGLLTFDPGISEELIDRALADVEHPQRSRRWRFRRPDPNPPDVSRVTDAWAVSESVKRIALAPAVLDLLRCLYGAEPRPFQTLNFKVGT